LLIKIVLSFEKRFTINKDFETADCLASNLRHIFDDNKVNEFLEFEKNNRLDVLENELEKLKKRILCFQKKSVKTNVMILQFDQIVKSLFQESEPFVEFTMLLNFLKFLISKSVRVLSIVADLLGKSILRFNR
jgi:hypothetical protein